MNIVIPMAGLGRRFKGAGFRESKPLIPILGKPMYAYACESLPLNYAEKIIFIILKSMSDHDILKEDIKTRYKRYNPIILSLENLTEGQMMTVLAAKDYINDESPLLIHNADTAFHINKPWWDIALMEKYNGALLVFTSNEDRWSYSKEDKNGFVVEVREKKVISNFASTGTYWFDRGKEYVSIAEEKFRQKIKERGEYYISPLYNDLIERGGKVKNFVVDQFYCFGTPADLESSLKKMKGTSETQEK